MTVELRHHQLGDIGSKTMIYKRGKHIETLYVLPVIKGDNNG